MKDMDQFLERDREDEMKDLVEQFTEEDYAFLEEMNDLIREFQ